MYMIYKSLSITTKKCLFNIDYMNSNYYNDNSNTNS